MDDNVDKFPDFYQKEVFPSFMLDRIKELNINGLTISDFGGRGFTQIEGAAINYEICKKDGNIGIIFNVHNSLAMLTVDKLSNEEQRKKFLPQMMNYDKIGAFALTEPDNGSDAGHIKTTAKKVEGGYLLTGQKRWISISDIATFVVVWAKNEAEGNKIQSFLVEKPCKGFVVKNMKNKFSLRMVQSGDITMKDCFVPDFNRLEYGTDFMKGTVAILMKSRLCVAWATVSGACGSYEECVKYCMKRYQFGKPIASF